MPQHWSFDDGTVVRLGGVVEGDSTFAHDIRLAVEAARGGFPSFVEALPDGDTEPLHLDDADHVDALVRARAERFGVQLVHDTRVGGRRSVGRDDSQSIRCGH